MASSMRVERSANCSRKSGRCLDCAASTASSINSSACLDNGGANFTRPRPVLGGGDTLDFILRIDEEENGQASQLASRCSPLTLPGSLNVSQLLGGAM